MIVGDIIGNQPAQMKVIEDKYVAEKLAWTASNPSLRDSILPGTSKTDPPGFDATGCRLLRHIEMEDLASAVFDNEEAIKNSKGECGTVKKSSAVLGDNRFWFDDDQHGAPGRQKPAEQNPKYLIVDLHPRAGILSFENAKLLA